MILLVIETKLNMSVAYRQPSTLNVVDSKVIDVVNWYNLYN